MRCLALASRLKQNEVHIRFISRHLPQYLRDMLVQRCIEFTSLETGTDASEIDELAHARWLNVSQLRDAQDSIQALAGQLWDWLIVDHYALDERWEAAMRGICQRILVIDDIADRRHDCDLLLDQNFYADMETRYVDKVPSYCRQLLGPRFALLRDEFHLARRISALREAPVRRVLVFFGGIDAHNYTAHAIEALAGIGDGLAVDVVIGLQHPHRAEIEEKCIRYNFVCHVQTNRFAELLVHADLLIGAGGASVWERACLGVPALTLCTANNQFRQIADAAFQGLIYAPEFSIDDSPEVWIGRHVRALMENSHLRRLISHRARQMVDGHGVSRVVANLECGGIELRVAEEIDSRKIFEWRNHPRIRESSRNSDVISWENHQKWFFSVTSDPNRILVIGYKRDLPIGVVRFDRHGERAEISIYLVQTEASSGQGYNLLLGAEQWVVKNYPDIKFIRAAVLGDNMRSQRLFSEAGYSLEFSHYLKRF